jgi:hypothetical protein
MSVSNFLDSVKYQQFREAYQQNCIEREAWKQPRLTEAEYYEIWVDLVEKNGDSPLTFLSE